MTQTAKLLALATLLSTACTQPDEVSEPEVVVEVQTAKAEVRTVEEMVRAPATVFPLAEARVAPKVAAPIARLAVRKGDRVIKGQPLARLRSEDLDAQLAEAKAQVTDAEANLEKVSAGTLPTEVERAQGEVERSEASLAEAKQIFERRQALVNEGALPERDLLLAKTQYEQAQTANRVAKSALELLTGRSRAQDIRIAESRLEQAQARLQFVEAQLGYTRIESPSNGVVTEQFLYPGDVARPDAPIFTVMDLSVAVARGQFPEERTGGLQAGQTCRFSAVDAPSSEHTGKLTVINQAVDPMRRTVEAWCEIPNANGALKAGAYGEVSVVRDVRPDAVVVPLASVQLEPDRTSGVVWTVGPDGAAHEAHVEVGVVTGESAEIRSGLRGGETVVIEGGFGLSDGVQVRTAGSSQ
ncbi:MAG: efflux RND transporter periplasmic adaptor subunit [Bryobacterales bacterium]|nr:efflux RND transporter periplasmic adaptor subunit [Bryobacterales bacterium]